MSIEGPKIHETPDNCPFCLIIEGKTKGNVIREDEKTVMLLSLEGHPLVVPRKHLQPEELKDHPEITQAMGLQALGSIDRVQAYFQSDGVNLFAAFGEAAGQEVEHAHIHIIPRFAGDSIGRFPRLTPKLGDQLERITLGLKAALN